MEEREWLTVSQVADLIQVHEQSVRRWIRAGKLPASYLGDKAGYRIRREDLASFMQMKQQTGGGQGES